MKTYDEIYQQRRRIEDKISQKEKKTRPSGFLHTPEMESHFHKYDIMINRVLGIAAKLMSCALDKILEKV